MKANILIILLQFSIVLGYYSLNLNKVYFQQLSNNNDTFDNITQTSLTEDQIEDLEEYIDLPLNSSELNLLNESYIKTKNIKSELYTIDSYIGTEKQHFRLLLSTFDDISSIASTECHSCNVSNKYNTSLSNSSINISEINNEETKNFGYSKFKDSLLVTSEKKINEIKSKNNITVDNFIFRVIESDNSGFMNSDLIDGILSLSYSNISQIPNNNFIMELYKEGKISSPSFSIIITSSNINRLYLGDIMKNDYIKNYVNHSMTKGKCEIIDNKWQCKTIYMTYTGSSDYGGKRSSSLVKFNLKENKLIIPSRYYYYLIVGYKYVYVYSDKYRSRSEYTTKHLANKQECYQFRGEINSIYCTCPQGKDSFGIMSLFFGGFSRLDVDLRDYVYYDENALLYKCRIDAILSKEDEFIIGLKGLNNTILSFDLEDKKIEFFHRKKDYDTLNIFIFILYLVIILVIIYVIIIPPSSIINIFR